MDELRIPLTPRAAVRWLVAGAAAGLLLAACQPAAQEPLPVASAYWESERLLYLGDPYNGQVRVLRLGSVVTEQRRLASNERVGTREIRVDTALGRVWVLGERTLHLHDAHNGALLSWWMAPSGVLFTQMALHDGLPEVVGADHTAYQVVGGERFLRPRG